MNCRSSILAFGLLALSGCSVTATVAGQVQNSSETFSGTVTGYMDRSGVVQITSSKGTTCSGDYVFVTERTGQGVFHCSDGRSGPFDFVSTGRHGTGQGTLGTQNFTFTFG